MFKTVFLLIVNKFTKDERSEFIKIILLELLAISVPLETETPILAVAKLGASLIPSPTIITVCPSFINFLISSVFSAGKTPATTSLIPTSSATFLLVITLSPVNIITLFPAFFNLQITSFIFFLTTSFTPTKASTLFSSIKYKIVFLDSSSNFSSF